MSDKPRAGKGSSARSNGPKVEVENINQPGWRGKVDAEQYDAMRRAVLEVLPRTAPGLTQTEMRNKVVFHVPSGLFESRGKTDWWSKLVQLDLEAKGVIVREPNAKPLRWHRA